MRKICALVLTALALTVAGCAPKGQELKNGADVESAKIQGYAVISTTVDQAAKEITYTVPSHAKIIDFKSLEAEFSVSEGASWALKSGSEIDWSAPEFTIVVTSENKNTKNEYRVVRAYTTNYSDQSGNVVNTYTGDIAVTIDGGGTPVKVSGQKIILSRMFNSVISMQLKDFKFGSMTVGDVQVDSVGVFAGDKDGKFVISGIDSTTVNIGSEVNVNVDLLGWCDSKAGELSCLIVISGVPGMDILVEFKGAVFNDPTATEPLFVSVAGSKVMGLQEFKKGNLVYYGDASLDKSAFADVVQNIKLPTGSTMKWYNDKPFDPKENVQYFDVTSSDGSKTERYNITRKKVEFNNITKYSFEEWTEKPQEEPYTSYFIPLPEALQVPNDAVIMLKAMSAYEADGAFPATPEAAGKVGKAAKLETLDTHGGLLFGSIPYPKVTSGSMFVGNFNAGAAFEDAMLTTEFGLPYSGKKITSVKGWYKYTPGNQMYNNLNMMTGTDKALVSCIIYDISDNYSFTLTGHDTYTSSRIVGVGKVNPAPTTNFTEFKFDITYTKPYTPSNNSVYKMALITSASADGDHYIGAPGSVLVVDEIELVTE